MNRTHLSQGQRSDSQTKNIFVDGAESVWEGFLKTSWDQLWFSNLAVAEKTPDATLTPDQSLNKGWTQDQVLSVKTCPRMESRALNGWTGQDSRGGVLLSPGFRAMLSDCPGEGLSVCFDWCPSVCGACDRSSRMSLSCCRSWAWRLQQYRAAGSRGWASVLKMKPPAPKTHCPPSPPSSQDPTPSVPPPCRKWVGSKSR